jgi:hypothetical protein
VNNPPPYFAGLQGGQTMKELLSFGFIWLHLLATMV